MKNILSGFKDFISRGNVIELAIAVVIGTAFTQVVKAVVEGLISPLIAAIFGGTTLAKDWTYRGFEFGAVIDALILFLVTAAVVYFLIVVPLNRLAELRRKDPEAPDAPSVSEDTALLREIRDLLADQAAHRAQAQVTQRQN
ncbi:large conductance mechanosensitive channel protein MscL [Cellulomonas sp. P22]|uniref:large conductance mechanosensitive channel protein MscL n=1 Tax=Cellulomonas sp. P22 TaxID=3373189 RepID=UPI00378B7F15